MPDKKRNSERMQAFVGKKIVAITEEYYGFWCDSDEVTLCFDDGSKVTFDVCRPYSDGLNAWVLSLLDFLYRMFQTGKCCTHVLTLKINSGQRGLSREKRCAEVEVGISKNSRAKSFVIAFECVNCSFMCNTTLHQGDSESYVYSCPNCKHTHFFGSLMGSKAKTL